MDTQHMKAVVRSNDVDQIKTSLKEINKPSFHDLISWVDSSTSKDTMSFIIQELQNVGADVNEIRDGVNPLARTSLYDYVDLARLLVGCGADTKLIGGRFKYCKDSPLCHSILSGNYHYAVFLTDIGDRFANDSEADTCGWFSLQRRSPKLLALVLDEINESHHRITWTKWFFNTLQHCTVEPLALVFLQKGLLCFQNVHFLSRAFYFAATAGYITFMDLLVDIRPQVLQTDWLVKQSFPRKLRNHTDCVNRLLALRATPVELQKQCKFVIRQMLKPNITENVKSLPLPKIIADYLSECACQREPAHKKT